ncbi:MAG: NAD(P)/FAD-dependent oxidoreductase [Caldilineaceae bacterium]
MHAEHPRVVIVGAGFAGLWAARGLAGAPVQVSLVDRNNFHTFLPLLYQVAAAELEPEAIAYPVRSILRGMPNVDFLLAEVDGLDLAGQQIQTSAGTIPYDFLLLAAGSTNHFFGVPGGREHAFPLKTLEDGIALRSQILQCYEQASQESDPERRRQTLTFTIVGGGPTGVEFAGALAELINGPLRKDYPRLNKQESRVLLLEAQNALLPGLPPRLQVYARGRLQQMGVEVELGAQVEKITDSAVHIAGGQIIPTETVAWTAGVQGLSETSTWELPVVRGRRVAVLPTLQSPDHSNVYLLGDLAHLEEAGRALPMVASVATQQGKAAAQNILRQLRDQPPLPFRYHDKGSMVTIGRNAAVAHVFGRSFTGFPAWILWLGVHLFNLIGFRNRLLVMLNWAWDYFFFERAVRLILPRQQHTNIPPV